MSVHKDRDHKLEVENDDGHLHLHVVHPDTCPFESEWLAPYNDQLGEQFEVRTYTCGIGAVDNHVGISLEEGFGGAPTTPHDTEGWTKLMEVLEKWAKIFEQSEGAMPILWEESGSYDPYTGEYDHDYVWIPFELEEHFA